MAALLSFDDFGEAFDYCREKDQPMVVSVQGERWKLYPSGRADKRSAQEARPALPGREESE
jgi:hypothetical protein